MYVCVKCIVSQRVTRVCVPSKEPCIVSKEPCIVSKWQKSSLYFFIYTYTYTYLYIYIYSTSVYIHQRTKRALHCTQKSPISHPKELYLICQKSPKSCDFGPNYPRARLFQRNSPKRPISRQNKLNIQVTRPKSSKACYLERANE